MRVCVCTTGRDGIALTSLPHTWRSLCCCRTCGCLGLNGSWGRGTEGRVGCAGVSTASIPPPTRGLCCRAWWFSLAKNNATCVQEPGVPLTCQSVPPAFYTHPPRNNSCSVIMCTIKNGEGPEDQITHLTTLKKKKEEKEDSKHTTSDQVAIIQKLLLKKPVVSNKQNKSLFTLEQATSGKAEQ